MTRTMAHYRITAVHVVALLVVGAVVLGEHNGETVSGRTSCAQRAPIACCGLEGFSTSAAEHVIVEIKDPFRVRSVEGVITSQGGEWPEGVSPIFEIRRPGRSEKVRQLQTDAHGLFTMPKVPPGEYCFKATVTGWQSVVGTIVVTADADPKRTITLEMPLGV